MAINLKNLLCEKHTKDLYHATSYYAFDKMLKDDAIKLTFAGGSQEDTKFNRGKYFYLSTMRVKYGRYARAGNDIGSVVVIHLDGQKIASNFKVFPVDYWEMGREHSEQEDRIVSDKDEIKPISRFIIDVHIYLKLLEFPQNIRTLYSIYRQSLEKGIPVYFYPKEQEQAFMTQRTDKAFTDITKVLPPEPSKSNDEVDYEERSKVWYKEPGYELKDLVAFYYDQPAVNKNNYDRYVKLIQLYPDQAHQSIMADAHNAKSKHPEVFRDVVKILKKENLKTFKDLITFMINREHQRWLDSKNKK